MHAFHCPPRKIKVSAFPCTRFYPALPPAPRDVPAALKRHIHSQICQLNPRIFLRKIFKKERLKLLRCPDKFYNDLPRLFGTIVADVQLQRLLPLLLCRRQCRFSRFSIFSFGIKNLRNNIFFLLDAAAETVMSACIPFLSVFYFTRSENIIKKLTRRHPTDTQIM